MPNMTGRPGCWTMEMNGGSSAPYLACTPCVPLFCTLFNRGGNRRAFRLPGASGGSFPLYGGTFARSYSVSNESPYGVFQTVFFRFLTSACPRGKSLQRDEECLKTPVFSSFLVCSAVADPDHPDRRKLTN